MMWKIQGSLCSPTELRLQHIKVPYSRVRVGVKVKRLVDPLVRINRSLTVLASAELLKVHLKNTADFSNDKSFNFFFGWNWPEGHLWRIGFDVACDVRGFHLGHTINFDTLRFANRRNWKVHKYIMKFVFRTQRENCSIFSLSWILQKFWLSIAGFLKSLLSIERKYVKLLWLVVMDLK